MTIENICKQITPGAKFVIQLAIGKSLQACLICLSSFLACLSLWLVKGSTISRNRMDWTRPNSHTILQNRPDKLDVMWGAQLLPIAQAIVVILSPWHPTVTVLPKPFTICTQRQRIVFIVSILWHGAAFNWNVWQKRMRIILCWAGVVRCHLSSPSRCVKIMVCIELGINGRWKYRD